MLDDKLFVGTSGWNHDNWNDKVYPPSLNKDERLSFLYNEKGISLVELDEIFTSKFDSNYIQKVLEIAPADMKFTLKVPYLLSVKILTSNGTILRDEKSMKEFLLAIEPLIKEDRLTAINGEFSPRHKKSEDTVEHLKWFINQFRFTSKLCLTFNCDSWLTPTTFELISSLDANVAYFDKPKLAGGRFLKLTSPCNQINFIKFSGQSQDWFSTSSSKRYDYLYSIDELRQFIWPVKKIFEAGQTSSIIFANGTNGYSIENAMDFGVMLKESLAVQDNLS
ncbi:MAG: DUF72 domain-containing protein [Nitrospinota bacterium]